LAEKSCKSNDREIDRDISSEINTYSDIALEGDQDDAMKLSNPRNMFFVSGSESYIFSHHAGILLHSAFITPFIREISIVRQWLISVLLGSLNIEQSKLLNFSSLENMFGKLSKSLNLQRQLLGEHACIDNNNIMGDLFRYNSEIVKASDCTDFYYDPHTKPYRGLQKILKGWCGGLNRAYKIINMDFIHTCGGEPVWFFHYDNFYDLRERFFKNITNFMNVLNFSVDKGLTFVVDRGIYKLELFGDVIDSPHHLITWEKGYKRGQWDDEKKDGEFVMNKFRNNSGDLLIFKFEYMKRDWSRDSRMSQIIVKAINPKQNSIEVSILTDDKDRDVKEVIQLMFRRWVQENDFKYLIKHFGIDEITSYDSIFYDQFKGKIEDKQVKSGEIKSLKKNKSKLEKELQKALLSEHQSKRRSKKREEKIKKLTLEVSKIIGQIDETTDEESKLNALIKDGVKKLKTNKKALMDVIKIIARNIFYKSLAPFKSLYDNYRDDHVIYRNLTHADGCMQYREKTVNVILFPTMQYAPKMKKIVDKYLQQINDDKPIMPDGSNRKIIFSLAKKGENKIAI
jgi:hypothetical protein